MCGVSTDPCRDHGTVSVKSIIDTTMLLLSVTGLTIKDLGWDRGANCLLSHGGRTVHKSTRMKGWHAARASFPFQVCTHHGPVGEEGRLLPQHLQLAVVQLAAVLRLDGPLGVRAPATAAAAAAARY